MFRLALILVSVMVAASANAQWTSAIGKRGGHWEGTFGLKYQDSEFLGSQEGSSLKFDSDYGFMLGIAYNFSDHFSAGFDVDYLRAFYQADLISATPGEPDVQFGHKGDFTSFMFNGTYNFISGSFTPYISASAGWQYFDSNIIDGDPIIGCYWHPYWGYICNDYYQTYTETSFGYGAAAGLRWEIDSSMFIKASISQDWFDMGGAHSDPSFMSGAIEFGTRF
jgi:opacity protein-like surface antigen